MTPERWAYQITHIINAYYQGDSSQYPVNVEQIAKEYSHQKYPNDPITLIKGKRLPNFDGGLFKAPQGKKGWGIIYNSDMLKGRTNFTIAHEFGHYLLHRIEFPNGIECSQQDITRWDSEYGQIEHQANVFAANLLMPFDDYRKQIDSRDKVNFDMLSNCAERYNVSLIAATLRWIQYTERRAILVLSRDGYIFWARSSKRAYRSGKYIKTLNVPAVPIPQHSLASKSLSTENQKKAVKLPSGVWFEEPCEEMVIFSEFYDFSISLVTLDNL